MSEVKYFRVICFACFRKNVFGCFVLGKRGCFEVWMFCHFQQNGNFCFKNKQIKSLCLEGGEFACSLPLCSTLASEKGRKRYYCLWVLSHLKVSVFLEEEQGKTLAGLVCLSETADKNVL